MNILFISHTAGKTGAENVLLDVLRAVAEATPHTLFVALPDDGKTAFEQALSGVRIAGIKYFKYRSARNTTALLCRNIGYGLLFGLGRLRRYCKTRKIDLLYINSSVNITGILLARRLNIPCIWHIHEHSTAAHRWTPVWLDKYYRRWLFGSNCRSVFVSAGSRAVWAANLRVSSIPHSTVIYSRYAEMPAVSGKRPPHPFTFGFLGTLSQNKNVGALIRAFRQQVGDVRLLIAGAGERRKALVKLAADCQGITFAGFITDRHAFYSRISVLVVPSFNESWGLVALEAMSAGIPVIMTKNTGLAELFTNHRECIFIDPSDTTGLANAMAAVADNPEASQRMARRAQLRLEALALNQSFDARIIDIIHQSSTKPACIT
ncbi:MAG: glycosyltransferase family 4 protein [Prevotellaceae bacterium]|jgi:glycosyltransferase involved in cell wall biosynthesis|nr:glycosyltransferase family 4 protein [Prevotellaceae bacterium]